MKILLSLDFDGYYHDSICLDNVYSKEFHYNIIISCNKDMTIDDIKEKIDNVIKKTANEVNNEEYVLFDKVNCKNRLGKLAMLDVLQSVDTISIDDLSLDETIEFLEENYQLKNKKIILPGSYSLLDDLSEVLTKFSDQKNIFIKLKNNYSAISLEETKKTNAILDEIVKHIKQLNLSPFEQLIYLYDIVRDREYQVEDVTGYKSDSRDINNILFGDKIVCVGFSNLFTILANKLGIKCSNYLLEDDSEKHVSGHARNICEIKDEKYDIDGIYFVDTTYDCKENDNSYLDSYFFFAKTYDFFKKVDKNDYNVQDMIITKELPDELMKYISSDFYNKISKTYLIRTLRSLLKFMGIKNDISINNFIFPNKEELEPLIEQIIPIIPKFFNNISNDKFIKALYNVRKIEYYENPEKYKFDMDTLDVISYNSAFTLLASREALLLGALLGKETMRDKIIQSDIYNIKENIREEIEQVKLTKTLQNICNNKRLVK